MISRSCFEFGMPMEIKINNLKNNRKCKNYLKVTDVSSLHILHLQKGYYT